MEKQQFIQKAQSIHGNLYDYSKISDFIMSKDKVCIVCPKHGEFWQRQDIHLSGHGCPKCGHESTGRACRTKNLDISTNDVKFNVINSPKVPYENHIIGSIYLFINKLNNKKYVGQTYNKYTDRWTAHKNATDTFYFHLALQKYGWDNFDKYVIEQSDFRLNTPEEIESLKKWLDSRETYYIKQFNSNNKKFGYNLTEGGTCLPKTINNYTPKHLGKYVEQYDLNGNLIKVWDSVKEIYTTTKFKRDGISQCSKGLRDSYKGYKWKIYNKEKTVTKIKAITKAKAVLQYDLAGKFIKEFESSQDVQRQLGFSSSQIRACCRGEYKTSKGYVWIFKNNTIPKELSIEVLKARGLDKRIQQLSIDNKLIKIWYNTTEIEKQLGIPKAQINACLRGHTKTSNGYKWNLCSVEDL